MIKNKIDLKRYIESDSKARNQTGKTVHFYDFIGKYLIHMRKAEYYKNAKKGAFAKIWFKYHFFFYYILGAFLGYSIPLNTCEEGLYLPHRGTIVISIYSKIGKNCTINVGVNIGKNPYDKCIAPVVGDNCYIAPGAKLFGNIRIGNNVAIGANAVVNKSILKDNVTIAGVPAKIVSENGTEKYIRGTI